MAKLMGFDFEIHYKEGAKNVAANALFINQVLNYFLLCSVTRRKFFKTRSRPTGPQILSYNS